MEAKRKLKLKNTKYYAILCAFLFALGCVFAYFLANSKSMGDVVFYIPLFTLTIVAWALSFRRTRYMTAIKGAFSYLIDDDTDVEAVVLVKTEKSVKAVKGATELSIIVTQFAILVQIQ